MFCAVNGVKLWVRVTGEGAPLVLLHGNGEDHTIFDELTRAIGSEFRVYAPDLRCHGRSGAGALDYDEMTRDVSELIRLEGLDRPLVVGFSDGGIIGLKLAAEEPARIGGLIACGANAEPEGLKKSFLLAARARYLATRSKKLKLMLTGPHIPEGTLNAIRVPVLIAAGEKDVVRLQETLRIRNAIPGAELRIFDGADHDGYVAGSARLANTVRVFAARCAARRAD